MVLLWVGGVRSWISVGCSLEDFTFLPLFRCDWEDFPPDYRSAMLSRISQWAIVQLWFGGFHVWILVSYSLAHFTCGYSPAAAREISLLITG